MVLEVPWVVVTACLLVPHRALQVLNYNTIMCLAAAVSWSRPKQIRKLAIVSLTSRADAARGPYPLSAEDLVVVANALANGGPAAVAGGGQ
jgi:hypothetical protein